MAKILVGHLQPFIWPKEKGEISLQLGLITKIPMKFLSSTTFAPFENSMHHIIRLYFAGSCKAFSYNAIGLIIHRASSRHALKIRLSQVQIDDSPVYRIERKLGKGGFGQVYVGRAIIPSTSSNETSVASPEVSVEL